MCTELTWDENRNLAMTSSERSKSSQMTTITGRLGRKGWCKIRPNKISQSIALLRIPQPSATALMLQEPPPTWFRNKDHSTNRRKRRLRWLETRTSITSRAPPNTDSTQLRNRKTTGQISSLGEIKITLWSIWATKSKSCNISMRGQRGNRSESPPWLKSGLTRRTNRKSRTSQILASRYPIGDPLSTSPALSIAKPVGAP